MECERAIFRLPSLVAGSKAVHRRAIAEHARRARGVPRESTFARDSDRHAKRRPERRGRTSYGRISLHLGSRRSALTRRSQCGRYARASTLAALLMSLPLLWVVSLLSAQSEQVRTGAAALTGWKADAPGVRRHIRPSDVPAPMTGQAAEESRGSQVKVIQAPSGGAPKVPDGFAVQVFATGFKQPRVLRTAPNGDIFLSESGTGRVLVFRGNRRGRGAGKARGLRRKARPTVRHRVPSARRSEVRRCRSRQPGGPLPVSHRRGETGWSRRSDRRQHSDRAALDTRPGGFAGRPATVPLGWFGVQPRCGRHARHVPR